MENPDIHNAKTEGLKDVYPILLAIIEVAPEKSVLCQSEGCGHRVYKRIHIVRLEQQLLVLGSECCNRLFGQLLAHGKRPQYGTSQGKKLTPEEYQLLVENTEALIAHFKSLVVDDVIYEDDISEELPWMRQTFLSPWVGDDLDLRPREFSDTYWAEGMREAKAILSKTLSNPDAIGWRGLLKIEAARILRQRFNVDLTDHTNNTQLLIPTPSTEVVDEPTDKRRANANFDLFGDLLN